MPRYKLTIEYDGTPFLGWQRQAGGDATVQGAIEMAIQNFCGETVTLHAAGRTDAGVHATGQVAHVDLTKPWGADRVRDAINFHLKPAPVAVLSAETVSEEFHARFSATKRVYRYRLLTRRAPVALEKNRVWWVPTSLDAEAMHAAAQALIGHHDFTTFRAAQCQAKSPIKTLDSFASRRRY
jgi:tRNA pseudouridine38-40 synthase